LKACGFDRASAPVACPALAGAVERNKKGKTQQINSEKGEAFLLGVKPKES